MRNHHGRRSGQRAGLADEFEETDAVVGHDDAAVTLEPELLPRSDAPVVREERELLVASEPDKFLMPRASDMRYRWVCVRLDAIDVDELRELLVDAWRMCVPKKVAAAYEG